MKVSSSECKACARDTLIGNYGGAAGFMFCFFLTNVLYIAFKTGVALVLELLVGFNEMSGFPALLWEFLPNRIVTQLFIFLQYMLSPGLIAIAMSFRRGEKGSSSQLFYGFKHNVRGYALLAAICTGISLVLALPGDLLLLASLGYHPEAAVSDYPGMMAVSIFVQSMMSILGMMISLYLSLNFGLVYYVQADNPGYSLWESLRASKRLLRGSRGSYIYLQMSFIGWYLLGICTMGIGFLWILPYYYSSFLEFYITRKKQCKAELSAEWQ